MSKTSWFSFGHNHVHEIDGQLFDHDTIVRISASDPRAVMVAMFGQKWAFEYDHPPDHPLMRDLPIIDMSDKAESCEAEELISLHDGIPAVWVCDLCGQPIGKGGRCNSAIHVGTEDGNAFNGHAIATTDLAAEYSAALARERDLIVDNQNLASALRAIRGPSDAGPWIDIYVEAGGGYAGLQAVAGAALDMVEEAHAAS